MGKRAREKEKNRDRKEEKKGERKKAKKRNGVTFCNL